MRPQDSPGCKKILELEARNASQRQFSTAKCGIFNVHPCASTVVLLSQAKLQQFAANSRGELPAGLCALPAGAQVRIESFGSRHNAWGCDFQTPASRRFSQASCLWRSNHKLPFLLLLFHIWPDILHLHNNQGEYWEGSLTRNTSALQPFSSGLPAQLSTTSATRRHLCCKVDRCIPVTIATSGPLLKSAQSHHLCFLWLRGKNKNMCIHIISIWTRLLLIYCIIYVCYSYVILCSVMLYYIIIIIILYYIILYSTTTVTTARKQSLNRESTTNSPISGAYPFLNYLSVPMAKNATATQTTVGIPTRSLSTYFIPFLRNFTNKKWPCKWVNFDPSQSYLLWKFVGMSLKATPATVWLSLGSLGLTPGNAHFISTYGLPCPSKSWNHTVCTEIDRCVTVMVIFLSQAPWYVGYGTIGMVWYGDVWCGNAVV